MPPLGCPNIADVSALPRATSVVWKRAPSMRPSATRSPRESTTAQLNLTLILSAKAHAAASAFWASA